jgi:hypothetical protein
MPRAPRSDSKVWNDIKKIKTGDIFKEKEIENLVVESMSRARNGNPIHENATGMAVEIVRNIFRYHNLTKAMRRYGKK